MKRSVRATAFLAAAILAIASLGQAAEDSYPTRPVRIVVPWPAGSVSDSLSRLVAERAAPHLGVPIVVENKPGASRLIGADHVAKSKPDGYVVLHGNFPLTSAPHVTAGRLRGWMVTSPRRVSSLPNVPTASELGFGDLEIVTWGGYFVPGRTPTKLVDRLNAALVRALNESDVRMKFKKWGVEPEPTSAQAFATFLVKERALWAKRAKLTGIRVSE